MDDNVQREYSQFETEDEDDDDDIFMEPEYSIGGTQPALFVSGGAQAERAISVSSAMTPLILASDQAMRV